MDGLALALKSFGWFTHIVSQVVIYLHAKTFLSISISIFIFPKWSGRQQQKLFFISFFVELGGGVDDALV